MLRTFGPMNYNRKNIHFCPLLITKIGKIVYYKMSLKILDYQIVKCP